MHIFGIHLVFFGCHDVFIFLAKSFDNLVQLGPGLRMVPHPHHAAEGVGPDVRVPPVVHRDVEIIPEFLILFEDLCVHWRFDVTKDVKLPKKRHVTCDIISNLLITLDL